MLHKKHCYGDRYGSFSTIQSAKSACLNGPNCQGVYDRGCNSEANDIYLCPTSVKYSTSSYPAESCIFQKIENGKYFKSFNIIKHLIVKQTRHITLLMITIS